MRQRAALAHLCEDRPVVMDEPFAHRCRDAARAADLAGRLLAGRTVVLVTHDPREALRLGHQVRVLSGPPSAGPAIRPPGAVTGAAADPALLGLRAGLIAELRGRAA